MDKRKRFGKFWRPLPWVIIVSLGINCPCISAEDPAKYPSEPITMIVQFAAGGLNDLTGRKLAESVGKILGQPVVVVNKVGGAGVIGTTAIAQSNPDGYTIGTISYSAPVIVPHLRSVPYNTKEDFTWIIQYADLAQFFCVKKESRWKTFKDLIEEARKHPGKLNYATAGPRGGQHIFMEYVFSLEKVKLNHVPGGAGPEIIAQLMGGHIDAAIASDMAPHMKSGKIRALALQGEKRLEAFSDIQTFAELGYTVNAPLWIGICGPKGLDPRITKKLHDAFKKAYEEPSFKELCATMAMTPIYKDSESFKRMVLRDFDSQREILKELGFAK